MGIGGSAAARGAELYRDVRANPDPQAGWRQWCETWAPLFAGHAQSPVPPPDRAAFAGPAIFACHPAWRVSVRLAAAAAEHVALHAGTDGTVTMHGFARTIGLEACGRRVDALLDLRLRRRRVRAVRGCVIRGGNPWRRPVSAGQRQGRRCLCLGHGWQGDAGFQLRLFPSCACSPHYICVLVPAWDRLAGAVPAGERLPASGL